MPDIGHASTDIETSDRSPKWVNGIEEQQRR